MTQQLDSPTPLPAVDMLVRLTRAADDVSYMPYIADLSFPCKALVVKAGLGKGKTSALVRHLRQHRYISVLIASPRRSLLIYLQLCCSFEGRSTFRLGANYRACSDGGRRE